MIILVNLEGENSILILYLQRVTTTNLCQFNTKHVKIVKAILEATSISVLIAE